MNEFGSIEPGSARLESLVNYNIKNMYKVFSGVIIASVILHVLNAKKSNIFRLIPIMLTPIYFF